MIVAAFAPLLAKEKSRSKAIELVRRRRAKPPPRVLLLVIFLSFFRLRRRRNKKSSYLARRGELKRSRYVKNPFFPYSFSLAFPLSRFSKRERERQREIFPKKKSGKEELREERERERIKSFILAMCIYQSGVLFFERERESQSSQVNLCKKYPKASSSATAHKQENKKTEREEEEGFWLHHHRHRSETEEQKNSQSSFCFGRAPLSSLSKTQKKSRAFVVTLSLFHFPRTKNAHCYY
jgi:hypothetical protein